MQGTTVNINLATDYALKPEIVSTLNDFHFKKIRISINRSNILLQRAKSDFAICRKGSREWEFFDNSLLKIQAELEKYKQPVENLLPNRVVSSELHHSPFIDELADQFEQNILSSIGQKSSVSTKKSFGVVMSHDVDGLGRFYLGSLKTAIVFFWNSIRLWAKPSLSLKYLVKSIRFAFGNIDYFGFSLILNVAKKYNFCPVFFLYSHLENNNKLTLLDRIKGVNPNYRIEREKYALTILKENDVEIGLHGSYYSSNDMSLLREEKEFLEEQLNITCKSVRQHYLNFHGGRTLDIYSELGINFDFNCGTVYENAFLCGTCRPFYYMPSKTTRPVVIIPMVYMDAVNLYFQPVSQIEICREIEKILLILRKYRGVASFNFHQRMISSIPEMLIAYEYLSSKTAELGGQFLRGDDLNRFYEIN